ncbi:hypothetical protein GQ43DRAFT_439357 [Delitschia confertaspora ATCC 74209]|uniref:Uncharacterized protein n=1 Tax=Delitschia confertaspora ATCC 74209 TaxID=1513339 RepID=A0A9P4JT87_9PLEO|nr:hypothetical protein GQ43DRAFT_439357 [Delitschia confertaspora ATCC 74209]
MRFQLSAFVYLFFYLIFASVCVASGCSAPPCGRVINKTRWPGKYGDFGGKKHKCHIYNWNDGHGSIKWDEKRGVPCTQYDLDADSSKGGFTHDRIDVDGITFHDRRWRIIWEHGESYDFAKGVWAKIGSGEEITCRENKEVPECKVKCVTDVLNACIGD